MYYLFLTFSLHSIFSLALVDIALKSTYEFIHNFVICSVIEASTLCICLVLLKAFNLLGPCAIS